MPTRHSHKPRDVSRSRKTLLLGLLFFSLAPGCGASERELEGATPDSPPNSHDAPPLLTDDPPPPKVVDNDGRRGRSTGTTKTVLPPPQITKAVPPSPPPDKLLQVTTGIDAALLRLRSEYPDLELLCSDKKCVQEIDLDGDRKVDVVVPVRAKCGRDRCPTGVVVLPTKAPEIRIGAGKQTRVRQVDWELIDGKLVWESLGKAATLRSTQGLKIRATKKSLCARSTRIGRAVLEFDGGDAVEALMFRRGHWEWVPCGY